MKEIQLQKQIRDWINYNGGYVWRQNAGRFIAQNDAGQTRMIQVGIKGVSDIIGVWKGKFLAIEVKVGKNKPSEFQLRFLEEVEKRNGISFLAYSLDEVIEKLAN